MTLDVQELYQINVPIENANCVIAREIHASIGFGQQWMVIIVKYDQWQSIVSNYDTQTHELVSGKVCIVDNLHHLCPNASSHIAMCVSQVTWKQWFEWQTTRWALTCINVCTFPVPRRLWFCS